MEKEKFIEKKQLEQVVEKIDRDTDGVVVEGIGDRYVLRRLGFRGKIFLSAEKTMEDLVENVSRGADRVGVLTDFDQHGKDEAKKITHQLQKEIDVVKTIRDDFGKQLTSTGRRTVEEIKPLFESKEDKFVDVALDRLYPGKDSELI